MEKKSKANKEISTKLKRMHELNVSIDFRYNILTDMSKVNYSSLTAGLGETTETYEGFDT
jgi:hypothetical protein